MKRLILITLLLVPLAFVVGCTKSPERTKVAVVDGKSITEADLNTLIGGYINQIERRVHQVKMGGLNHLIEQKLLENAAKKAGMEKEAWLDSQIDPKDLKVTDKEINEIWEKQKGRIKMTKEEFIPQLRSHLERQKKNQAAQAILAKLKSDAESSGKIKIFLEEPKDEPVKVAIGDSPFKGSAKAKVTIVEFSDYQCPACAGSQDALHKVLEHYGNKVRLVAKDFPLPRHTEARPAAEAAYCVQEQDDGKFWEFRAELFKRTKNGESLKTETLKGIVSDLGLNTDAYESCFKAKKYADKVNKHFAEGQEIPVRGTPTFIIVKGNKNEGEQFTQAPTFENFKRVIDKML
ncbi:thioredoxin domain-containing protein [Bdellovibrionota bacterium]